MAFPLKQITEPKLILNDLEYYENKIQEYDTPAMTQGIFGLLYSRLKDAEKSYSFFRMSFKPNLLKPFGVMA